MASSRTTDNVTNTQFNLLTTTKTFHFKASDHWAKHGHYWINGITPTLGGITVLLTGADSFIIGIVLLLTGLVILIFFGACVIAAYLRSEAYTVSFNAEELSVSIYREGDLIHFIPYQHFKQLFFKKHCEQYCVFYFCGCIRWGQRSYLGARVYVEKSNGQKQKINDTFCIGREISTVECMVLEANQYFKNNRFCVVGAVAGNVDIENQREGYGESERIPIGSRCYVDCKSVYGVVIGYLPDNGYTIIDLFEQRQRRTEEDRLTLITDEKVLNDVDEQYGQYLTDNKPNIVLNS